MHLRPGLLALARSALLNLVAAQDDVAGQRVSNQCRTCHTVEQGGRNGVGPRRHGVFGRPAVAVEGFRHGAPRPQRA